MISPPPLTVCMEKMTHRDIEAICNILYGLSDESLLCSPPKIYFCIVHRITLFPRINISVCVSVLCKIRYTREVKATVMQVVN